MIFIIAKKVENFDKAEKRGEWRGGIFIINVSDNDHCLFWYDISGVIVMGAAFRSLCKHHRRECV